MHTKKMLFRISIHVQKSLIRWNLGKRSMMDIITMKQVYS